MPKQSNLLNLLDTASEIHLLHLQSKMLKYSFKNLLNTASEIHLVHLQSKMLKYS